jgi:hypothetical protein
MSASYSDRAYGPGAEPCHHVGVYQERRWLQERRERAYNASRKPVSPLARAFFSVPTLMGGRTE